jgi:hypothetical protein
VIVPAMAVLAANVEADALTMLKDVYQQVNNIGAAGTWAKAMLVKKLLDDALAPPDEDRTMLLNTQDQVDVVVDTKGLFQSADQIAKQYKTGMMGMSAGFDWYQNTLLTSSPRARMRTATR